MQASDSLVAEFPAIDKTHSRLIVQFVSGILQFLIRDVPVCYLAAVQNRVYGTLDRGLLIEDSRLVNDIQRSLNGERTEGTL